MNSDDLDDLDRLRWQIARSAIATAVLPAGMGGLLYTVIAETSYWRLGMIAGGLLALLVLVAFGWETFEALRTYRRILVNDRATRQAEDRGRELLVRLLSPEQRQEFDHTGRITLHVAGGYKAMIGQGISGVLWQTRQGNSFAQCVSVPLVVKADDTLAKLLALRNDPIGVAAISAMRLDARSVSTDPHRVRHLD